MKQHIQIVGQVLQPLKQFKSPRVVEQLRKHTSEMNCAVAIPMEECQVRWTTYKNLSMWFDEWESELCRLGFGNHDESGSLIIPENQLKHIINFDETALSLDGLEGRCGGRPAVEFYDPNLPASYKRTSKLSVTITMITGSLAAGEPLAPHFQFPTKAKRRSPVLGGSQNNKCRACVRFSTLCTSRTKKICTTDSLDRLICGT